MYTEISSRTNEKVKFAANLAKSATLRQQHKLFFAEGAKLCQDLAQSFKAKIVFFTAKALAQNKNIALFCDEKYLVQPHVAEKLSLTKASQGVFAVFEKGEDAAAQINFEKGLVVCENMQDPGNVGTVVRTAAALGLGGVLLCGDCADLYSPKTLRAACGGIGRVPASTEKDALAACARLKALGVRLYATALGPGAKPLAGAAPAGKFALIIGSEGSGVSAGVIAASHETIYLPMQNGVESLNAGVAAGIFIYHFKMLV